MWGDALRVDQPVQYRSRPAGGIGREPVRLQTKALVNLVGVCPLPSQRVETPGYFNRDAAWTEGSRKTVTVSTRSLIASAALESPA